MSTDFTLYALDESQVPAARQQMAGSLGYGNTNMASIIAGAAALQSDRARGGATSYDVYDAPSFVVDHDHTSFHGDEPCTAHDLAVLIGPDLPVIDRALIRKVMDTIGKSYADGTVWPKDKPKADGTWDYRRAKPYEFRMRLEAWLEGARGRRLWYCFV